MRIPVWCFLILAMLATARPVAAQIEQRSLRFNDPVLAGQYLSVTNKTGLQNLNGLTIEAWVRPTSYSNFPTIVGNNFQSSYWLGLSTTGALRFYPNASVSYFEFGNIPLDEWTHVAVTYNAVTGAAGLYKNGFGMYFSTGWSGDTGSDPGDLRIGADRLSGSPSFHFRGYLDEVRIWNVARTPPQIYATHDVHCAGPSVAGSAYDGLVGYWTMQQIMGGAVPDVQSGLGEAANDAVLVGGPPLSTLGPPMFHDNALSLNGTSDHAIVPVTNGFGAGLTVSAWIAPASFASIPTIVGRNFTSSFWFGLNPSGRLRFYPTGGPGQYVESATAVAADRWTHVAATYRNGMTRFYLNGQLDAWSTAISGSVGENGLAAFVGADNIGPAYFFEGAIDQVRIVRGALSALGIRDGMFRLPGTLPGFVADQDGVLREQLGFQAEYAPATTVNGSAAVLVPCPMPVFAPEANGYGASLSGWHTRIVGDMSSDLPPISSTIVVTQNVPIIDVNVLATGTASDVARTQLRLRSPAGTVVTLKGSTLGRGTSIHAIFDDEASATLTSGVPPYVDGVRPQNALGTFDGESSMGTWTLEFVPDEFQRVGLGAWGLSINDFVTAGTGESPVDEVVALAHAGAHPVRSGGVLRYTAPVDAKVLVTLHDLRGRRVLTLFQGWGSTATRMLPWSARGVVPGVYWVRLTVGGVQRAALKTLVIR